jgi:HPt (histidine-containing phosphotransfer) domain-containing protein
MDDYLTKPVRVEALTQALLRCARRTDHLLVEDPVAQADTPQRTAQPAVRPAIDPAKLAEFREAMGAEADNIVKLFLEDAANLLSQIQQAVREGESDSLRIAAHTLKSSSASIGADVLSRVAKELEDQGRAESLEGAAAKAAQAEAEYRRVKAVLLS